jgi:hypothetical protein
MSLGNYGDITLHTEGSIGESLLDDDPIRIRAPKKAVRANADLMGWHSSG